MTYVTSQVYIEGLYEAVAGLRDLGAEKEIQALNLRVGNMVVKEAKQLVPVRTGRLRDSIRASKAIRTAVVQAGRDPLIPYANPINWGWFYDKEYFIAKNIMPTQFMNKAAKKVRAQIATTYMTELVRLYEKYAGKPYTGNKDIQQVVNATRGFAD
jgi:hypothetical protein